MELHQPALNFNNNVATTWNIHINSSAYEPLINHDSIENTNDNSNTDDDDDDNNNNNNPIY